MKETSFKAGVIGGLCGVFTFLALFSTTSKASINESVSGPGIPGTKYVLRDSEKGGLCVLNP